MYHSTQITTLWHASRSIHHVRPRSCLLHLILNLLADVYIHEQYASGDCWHGMYFILYQVWAMKQQVDAQVAKKLIWAELSDKIKKKERYNTYCTKHFIIPYTVCSIYYTKRFIDCNYNVDNLYSGTLPNWTAEIRMPPYSGHLLWSIYILTTSEIRTPS